MMRIQILSDLHNEFWRMRHLPAPEIRETDADIIVLAGDIDNGLDDVHWAIGQSDRLDRQVVYVCGNHEFYSWCPREVLSQLRRIASGTRVHLLENESVEINGVRFLGTTLWTDFCCLRVARKEECMREEGLAVTDYRTIRFHMSDGEHRNLRPTDTADWHLKSSTWLQSNLNSSRPPTVVVVHHGPSDRCHDAARWGAPDPTSVSFWSNVEELIRPETAKIADIRTYAREHSIHG